MGTVLKVVTIPRESWHDLEEVVLEEMTVFRVGYLEIGAKFHPFIVNCWNVEWSAFVLYRSLHP